MKIIFMKRRAEKNEKIQKDPHSDLMKMTVQV